MERPTMNLTRYALWIPFAALAACGGGTIRVADDDSSSNNGPVSLAPTPDSEPAPSVAAAAPAPAEPAQDSAAAPVAGAQGYSSYGAGGNSTLDIRRIGQWSRTGIGESRRLVIRDANAWAEFWSELGTGDRPAVDFTHNVVVAVAAGQRPSGGYEIAIDRIREAGGELTVDVVETAPGPN